MIINSSGLVVFFTNIKYILRLYSPNFHYVRKYKLLLRSGFLCILLSVLVFVYLKNIRRVKNIHRIHAWERYYLFLNGFVSIIHWLGSITKTNRLDFLFSLVLQIKYFQWKIKGDSLCNKARRCLSLTHRLADCLT